MKENIPENDWSCRWIIDGMKRMLRDGLVHVEMSFKDVQDLCDEPDLCEFEDLNQMLWSWEKAKTEYRRSLMPLKVEMS